MPHLTPTTFRRLLEAAAERDGAVLVDPEGRRQLALVVDPARLDAVRPGHEEQHNLPLHRLLAALDLAEVPAFGPRAPRRRHLGRPARRAVVHSLIRAQGLRSRPIPGHIGGVNLHDWIDELADVLDVEAEVDEGLVNDLVTLVGDNVERSAGPVTAYLLGVAARDQDADPEAIEQLAARAQSLAEGWDRPADAPDPDDILDDVPDDSGVDHSRDVYAG